MKVSLAILFTLVTASSVGFSSSSRRPLQQRRNDNQKPFWNTPITDSSISARIPKSALYIGMSYLETLKTNEEGDSNQRSSNNDRYKAPSVDVGSSNDYLSALAASQKSASSSKPKTVSSGSPAGDYLGAMSSPKTNGSNNDGGSGSGSKLQRVLSFIGKTGIASTESNETPKSSPAARDDYFRSMSSSSQQSTTASESSSNESASANKRQQQQRSDDPGKFKRVLGYLGNKMKAAYDYSSDEEAGEKDMNGLSATFPSTRSSRSSALEPSNDKTDSNSRLSSSVLTSPSTDYVTAMSGGSSSAAGSEAKPAPAAASYSGFPGAAWSPGGGGGGGGGSNDASNSHSSKSSDNKSTEPKASSSYSGFPGAAWSPGASTTSNSVSSSSSSSKSTSSTAPKKSSYSGFPGAAWNPGASGGDETSSEQASSGSQGYESTSSAANEPKKASYSGFPGSAWNPGSGGDSSGSNGVNSNGTPSSSSTKEAEKASYSGFPGSAWSPGGGGDASHSGTSSSKSDSKYGLTLSPSTDSKKNSYSGFPGAAWSPNTAGNVPSSADTYKPPVDRSSYNAGSSSASHPAKASYSKPGSDWSQNQPSSFAPSMEDSRSSYSSTTMPLNDIKQTASYSGLPGSDWAPDASNSEASTVDNSRNSYSTAPKSTSSYSGFPGSAWSPGSSTSSTPAVDNSRSGYSAESTQSRDIKDTSYSGFPGSTWSPGDLGSSSTTDQVSAKGSYNSAAKSSANQSKSASYSGFPGSTWSPGSSSSSSNQESVHDESKEKLSPPSQASYSGFPGAAWSFGGTINAGSQDVPSNKIGQEGSSTYSGFPGSSWSPAHGNGSSGSTQQSSGSKKAALSQPSKPSYSGFPGAAWSSGNASNSRNDGRERRNDVVDQSSARIPSWVSNDRQPLEKDRTNQNLSSLDTQGPVWNASPKSVPSHGKLAHSLNVPDTKHYFSGFLEELSGEDSSSEYDQREKLPSAEKQSSSNVVSKNTSFSGFLDDLSSDSRASKSHNSRSSHTKEKVARDSRTASSATQPESYVSGNTFATNPVATPSPSPSSSNWFTPSADSDPNLSIERSVGMAPLVRTPLVREDPYVDEQLETAIIALQHEIERLSDQLAAQGDDIQSLLILGRSMREQDEDYREQENIRQQERFDGMHRELEGLTGRLALLEEIQLESERIKESIENVVDASDTKMLNMNIYDSPSPNDVLYLNVGGMPLDVLRGTLTFFPDSMLAQEFSGEWDERLVKDHEGRFMVNEDPELFAELVNYLRDQGRRADDRFIDPPGFKNINQQQRFHRLVDSYELTKHMYRFSVCTVREDPLPVSYPISNALLIPVTNDEADLKDFVLQRDGKHARNVDSFEVELGRDTCGAVGWSIYDTDRFDGFCFDNEDRVVLAILYIYRTGLQESISFRLGDVTQSIPTNAIIRDNEPVRIRCANRGTEWYVNDVLVATTPAVHRALSYKVDAAPYVSCTKGSICFTDLTLVA
ncbi:hypothetical protein MPSEU_000984600 [Mayamaea pseudoterrestris]|nr:hypothetical protein MPSEU_000984600 [Mayamaea pseudoterrestris]